MINSVWFPTEVVEEKEGQNKRVWVLSIAKPEQENCFTAFTFGDSQGGERGFSSEDQCQRACDFLKQQQYTYQDISNMSLEERFTLFQEIIDAT